MLTQWPLLLFSLIAGIGGSLLAVAGLGKLAGFGEKSQKPAYIIALVLMFVGGCFSVLHLQQPANIMAAAANIFSFSGISVELMTIGVALIIAVICIIAAAKDSKGVGVKVLAVLAIVFGLLLGYVTGNGYVFGAQPNWNTVLLPIAYLLTDVLPGALLMLIIMAAKKDDEAGYKLPVIIALAAGVLAIADVIAYAAFVKFAIDAILLWVGVVAMLAIAAILVALYFAKKGNICVFATGAIAAIVAGVCFRIAMWAVGTGVLHLFDAAYNHLVL